MGLNISVYKLTRNEMRNRYDSEELPLNEWDYIRYVGDRAFAQHKNIAFDYINRDEYKDIYYYRPHDLDKALEVIKTLPNPDRFKDILLRMKKDKSLYFYFGY